MTLLRSSILIALTLVTAGQTTVVAGTPQEAFRTGNTQLQEGNLRAALQSYADAVRADRDNQDFVRQYLRVRQAVLLQQNLAKERNSQRRLQYAQALRSFFVGLDLYNHALALDEQIHAQLNSSDSAVQLAETQLKLGRHADAERLLKENDKQSPTAASRALLTVALARQEKTDEAKQILVSTNVAERATADTFYYLAQAHASVQDADAAVSLLVKYFEATPPSRLELTKSNVQTCPEFTSLVSTSQFVDALQTESRVQESKCSGGSKCSGCPMRGKCSHGK